MMGLGRPTAVKDAAGTQEFTYDDDFNLTSSTDRRGKTAYTYKGMRHASLSGRLD